MNVQEELKHTGAFDRAYEIAKISSLLTRDELSKEEVEGMIKLLPPDLKSNMGYLIRPEVLPASLAMMRMLSVYLEELKQAREQGKKVIFAPINFVPEVIHAFDNAVLFISEFFTGLAMLMVEGQGDRYWDYAMGLGLPDHLCSSNATGAASLLMGDGLRPDAIIGASTGVCDPSAKILDFVAETLDIPQFVLEKMTENTGRGQQMYRKNFKRLVGDLEEFLGEQLNEDKLRAVCEKANHATELYWDICELVKVSPCPVPNPVKLYPLMTRVTMWGRDEAIPVLEKIIEISKKNMNDPVMMSRPELARIVWLWVSYYTDFTNFFEWFVKNDLSQVMDILFIIFANIIDTSSMDSMLDGIADAASNSGMTRQMGANSMAVQWAEDVIFMIKEYNATGAIFGGHHSCKGPWSVFSMVRKEITKRTGVPILALQGDAWNKRITPVSSIQSEIDQFVKAVVRKTNGKGGKPGEGSAG